MFLHRIHLNPRCGHARRDLADAYQMHSTLCRAFSESNQKCPPCEFLWRLEPETDGDGFPRVLVQSRSIPDWERIADMEWFARDPDPSIDLAQKLQLDTLQIGQRFRFRLRANPCIERQGRRQGLLRAEEQETWISRKGLNQCGFSLPEAGSWIVARPSSRRVSLQITQEQMIRVKQRSGNDLTVFSVLYDGVLIVSDPSAFRQAFAAGIGHGKALGLGLLSLVPLT